MKAPHLVNVVDPVKHAQAKKIWSPAFSPKALLEQEDVVLKYADMLMVAVSEESRKGPLNLIDFYNWVTFDGTSPDSQYFSLGMLSNKTCSSG